MTLLAAIAALAFAWAAAGTLARVGNHDAVRRRLGIPAVATPRIERRSRRPRPSGALRSVPDAATARRLGWSCVLGVFAAAAVRAPIAGLAVAALVHVSPALARRRRPRAELVEAVARLPDAIDLLAVAARAGLPAPAAVGLVAERAPPPWGPVLVAVVDRTRRGERFTDALDELGRVADGSVGQALRAVLRSATDDGADLLAGLDRLATDARDLRRRRAEEAARRVPVRLLLPLVACSLPAFALLTIVPIVAGALQALDL